MNLEDCGIVREDILNGIVNKLCEDFDNSALTSVTATVRDHVETKTAKAVTEAVGKEIELVLSSEFQPINVFGDKHGDPTTVKELIAKGVTEWWSEKVDSRGNTGYDASIPRSTYLAKTIAQEVLTKELRSTFNDLFKQMKEDLRGRVAQELTSTLKYFMK